VGRKRNCRKVAANEERVPIAVAQKSPWLGGLVKILKTAWVRKGGERDKYPRERFSHAL